jgi:hypothetical protein
MRFYQIPVAATALACSFAISSTLGLVHLQAGRDHHHQHGVDAAGTPGPHNQTCVSHIASGSRFCCDTLRWLQADEERLDDGLPGMTWYPEGQQIQAASTSTAIDESNKGFQLLQKMGWSKGKGLGKQETG